MDNSGLGDVGVDEDGLVVSGGVSLLGNEGASCDASLSLDPFVESRPPKRPLSLSDFKDIVKCYSCQLPEIPLHGGTHKLKTRQAR